MHAGYSCRLRFHAFRNEGREVAKLLCVATPGGPTDLLFREIAALKASQGRDADAAQVVAICGKYGITFAGV